MSKKRFTWKTEKLQHLNDEVLMIVDNANKEWKGHILNIVDLLNKQQATIERLEKENIELKKLKKYCAEWMGVKEENLSLRCVKMSEKRFRVNDLVKYDYSEIGEYVDENHTDRPLRNDEVCKLLNELHEENQQLKNRVYDFEKRKIIEESAIDEDVIPKIKLLRTELFGEKYE